jgi:elongation factor Ts
MIDPKLVTQLRGQTGAGIVDCKKALEETNGDLTKAAELLRKKGIAKAGSKGERATKEGLIDAYIHGNGKMGVLVEVQCETDFVARTEAFKEFVHEVAMQIAASNPLYLSPDQIPAEVVAKEKELAMAEFAGSSKPREVIEKIASGKLEKYYSEVCLLNQAYIKDEDKTMGDLLKETIAKTGENVQIKRFSRFAMGE